MDIISSLAVIAFAGLIHASFQLSVSMLTLLSGHAIGAKTARRRLLRRIDGFLLGAGIMTLLLLALTALWQQLVFHHQVPLVAWSTACGLLFSLGVAVWIFYYRHEPGTSLWLPRELARYLVQRTKITRSSAEAFSLGMGSVLAELLFIIGPLFVSGLVLIQLDPNWQLVGLGVYVAASLVSLLTVAFLIRSGQNVGRIQRWREANKGFLQFVAGCGLIVLSFYVYVSQISSNIIITKGGL